MASRGGDTLHNPRTHALVILHRLYSQLLMWWNNRNDNAKEAQQRKEGIPANTLSHSILLYIAQQSSHLCVRMLKLL
jgi:hypothetical protein